MCRCHSRACLPAQTLLSVRPPTQTTTTITLAPSHRIQAHEEGLKGVVPGLALPVPVGHYRHLLAVREVNHLAIRRDVQGVGVPGRLVGVESNRSAREACMWHACMWRYEGSDVALVLWHNLLYPGRRKRALGIAALRPFVSTDLCRACVLYRRVKFATVCNCKQPLVANLVAQLPADIATLGISANFPVSRKLGSTAPGAPGAPATSHNTTMATDTKAERSRHLKFAELERRNASRDSNVASAPHGNAVAPPAAPVAPVTKSGTISTAFGVSGGGADGVVVVLSPPAPPDAA
jgi:hypothetical protein